MVAIDVDNEVKADKLPKVDGNRGPLNSLSYRSIIPLKKISYLTQDGMESS